jgi:hypothetical protein
MTLLRLRGRGADSDVYAARRDLDGWSCAVKIMRSTADRERVRREIDVLIAATAPGLVRLHDVLATNDGRLALVLDLVDGGVLREVIADRGHLVPREVTGVLRVLLQALDGLHRRGITHGDLSAGNVLITRDGRAVLGDLGSARLVGERCREVWATRGFLAPEVESGGAPSPASDVYGVGALAWLMLTGEVPGRAYGRTPAHEALPDCPAALVELVAACLASDPQARPTAAVALDRCADLGPEEPLALPAGPDLGERLTARVRWHSEAVSGDDWAARVVGPDDPLRALGLDEKGRWRGRPLRQDADAADNRPGRHRGAEPGRLGRVASAGLRVATGPGARTASAAVAGMALGLAACVGIAGWRDAPLPLVGRVSLPFARASSGTPTEGANPGATGPTDPGGSSGEATGTSGAAGASTHSGPAVRVTPPPGLPPAASSSASSPSSSASSPSSSPSPSTSPSSRTSPSTGAAGPARNDQAVDPAAAPRALPTLLAERARAYATANPGPLDRCYAPGAAGLGSARADVRRLASLGTRYDGLAYPVHEARLLSTQDRDGVREARVAARVETVSARGGWDPAGESPLVFVLRWTEAGWRLWATETAPA